MVVLGFEYQALGTLDEVGNISARKVHFQHGLRKLKSALLAGVWVGA
jgi:hypothetical protein